MSRDDLAPIDVEQLPPWECCGEHGEHADDCEEVNERDHIVNQGEIRLMHWRLT